MADAVPLKIASGQIARFSGSDTVPVANIPATATPTANAIPKADGSGLLDGWITPSSSSSGASWKAVYQDFTDAASSHTDGTEDILRQVDLLQDLIGVGAPTSGDQFQIIQAMIMVGSATAARRAKLYISDGSTDVLIWDSGALTLALGGSFFIRIEIYHVDSGTRYVVGISTTSASTVPYVTIGDISNGTIDWEGTHFKVQLRAIASGTGAAANDIVSKSVIVSYAPAPTA